MKRLLFYFSGSGNSLAMARAIAEKLGNCELRSVVTALKANELITADEIGFVFPVYMHRTPKIVLRMLKLIQADYIFAVATNGGQMGVALSQLNTLLKRYGQKLDAGCSLQLPDNYTPFGAPPEADKQRELFAAADTKLALFAELVAQRGTSIDNETSFLNKWIWPGPFFALGYTMMPLLGRDFHATEGCNNCGTCTKLCPVDNINTSGDKPKWEARCEQCFACLHWCPKEAVEYGKKTRGIARYRHPEVTLQDMLQQREA